MRRALCVLFGFALPCLVGCGAEPRPAVDTGEEGRPAILHLGMDNETAREWRAQLTYEVTAPQGETFGGALLAGAPVSANAHASFPDAVQSVIGARVAVVAAVWDAANPEFRRDMRIVLVLEAPVERCAVVALPAGDDAPPALGLSCSR